MASSIFAPFDDATRIAKPRNRQSGGRPIPTSNELLPTRLHREARPEFGVFVCHTKAGRPRAFCLPDKEGRCIHCGYLDPDLDRPLGEMAH